MGGARGRGFRRLTILVVDDEGDILELLSDMLRGHDVLTASGCAEAEAVMLRRGASLDAVVSDYRMPGRSGADVLRAASHHSPRAIRVLLTACPPDELGELVDTGVVHFCLLKSFITFPDFYDVARRLSRAGYVVLWDVLNSRDFRVPQDRKRVFLVGFLRGAPFAFPRGEPGASGTMAAILEPDVPDEYNLAEEHHEGVKRHCERIGRRLLETRPDGISVTLLASYASNLNRGPYVRAAIPAGRTPCYSDGNPLLRRLTPRECARLQGFPDDFTVLGPDAEAYRQLGNAVTVTVAEAIATNLKVVLPR